MRILTLVDVENLKTDLDVLKVDRPVKVDCYETFLSFEKKLWQTHQSFSFDKNKLIVY